MHGPSTFVSVPETFYPYRGKIRINQYNPSKPAKYGLPQAKSITWKPRKWRNPWKFFFPSQTKYSPPIITFVQGVNSYLEIVSPDKQENQPSANSAELQCRANPRNRWKFLSIEDFLFLFIEVLKGTVLIRQITNNECLRGIATRINQFLSIFVSRDPCFHLSSKKLALFNFLLFCTLGITFNTLKKQSSFLSGNNTTFSELSADSADSQCRVNPRNQRKFLNHENFHFSLLKP